MPRTEVPQDDVTGCLAAVAGEDVLRPVAQDAAHGQAICAHAGAVAAICDAHGPQRGTDGTGDGRRCQRDPWELQLNILMLGLQLEILLDDRAFDVSSQGGLRVRRWEPCRRLQKPPPFWKTLGRWSLWMSIIDMEESPRGLRDLELDFGILREEAGAPLRDDGPARQIRLAQAQLRDDSPA